MRKTISNYFVFSLAVMLLSFLFATNASAETSTPEYNISITESCSIVAEADKSISISGDSVIVNLSLPGITIDCSGRTSVSAIHIENGATVYLTIDGVNTLKGSEGCAAISVSQDSTLIIVDSSTGTLKAYAGIMAAAIGGDAECSSGTITINGGTIIAEGGDNGGAFADERGGAGIGGGNNGDGGTITINGGNIDSIGGESSAGIGGGNSGNTGTIVINEGQITVDGGYHGPGIGGNGGSVEINGGIIVADNWAYGAAIGCDSNGSGINITIKGGNITATADTFCAAIGGSISGTAGNITITGGTINAHGEEAGIGICNSISISGGTIIAEADASGTGIKSPNIMIASGDITAIGGSDGAGIGGEGGSILISGGTITATGGYGGAGVGGAKGKSGGNITITGGSIKAAAGSSDAQDIGNGAGGTGTVISNGDLHGNQALHLVAVEGALSSDSATKAHVVVTAGIPEESYEYLYSGYGHSDDTLLYFYLPETYILPNGLMEYDTGLLDGYDTHITESGIYVAVDGENIRVSGEDVMLALTLPGVSIDCSSETSVSAIRITDGATVRMKIVGTNTLKGSEGCAAISIDEHSTLIIESDSTGTLKAYAGILAAAIGGDAECNNGTIIMNGGTVTTVGGKNAGAFADERGGAGIGGGNNGSGGTITINGGIVNSTGGESSAGIGGGNTGATGTIIINNGHITVDGGYHGPGIGGRGGSVEINGGTIVADNWAYGAAIGCASDGSGINITINGGTITATADAFCAAIGGSISGTAGKITITGGTINAHGEEAGIGVCDSINISGGTIIAKADASGTGIMSADIIISGGIIESTGGSDGAGIGGCEGIVNITGGTIDATGGYGGAGIGGGKSQSAGTIQITGGSIRATAGSAGAQAVGIGAGGTGGIVTSGSENGDSPLHLVVVDGAFSDDNHLEANISVQTGDTENLYSYTYIGCGHTDDDLLYFYLPENYLLPDGLSEFDVSLLDGYDVHIFESGAYTAISGENIRVSGQDLILNLTIENTAIDRSADISVSAIKITDGATVRLKVLGTNVLKGAEGCAAISIDENSTLIIEAGSTGTLKAYAGILAAAIGGDAECNNGTIIINGGTITAIGGKNAGAFADERGGAGIGGGNNGSGGAITINGGTIQTTGGDSSAGIGGGSGGHTGTIVVNDGNIHANGGYEGPGIGGAGGLIEIKGGTIVADNWAYGAAIGCAASAGDGVTITITGGNITATASSFCAAIGGSWGDSAGNITITGGTILAEGEEAGIGVCESINISGGIITATADASGSAIRSGDITISDGIIDAAGGTEGAGIGGSEGTIRISGGTIYATGGYNASGVGGAGIGGASGQNSGTIIITGGSIKAVPGSVNAESVGAGANGETSSITNGPDRGNQALKLVKVKKPTSDNDEIITVAILSGSQEYLYRYTYSGNGHSGDDSLYFYLPDDYSGLVMSSTDTRLVQSYSESISNAATMIAASYDINGKMLSVNTYTADTSDADFKMPTDTFKISFFYLDTSYAPVISNRIMIVDEDLAAYAEFKDLFTISLRKTTDNNEKLFDVTYSGELAQDEFWAYWQRQLQNGEKLERYAEQFASEVRSDNPGYTSALYFKYQTVSLGYSFAYERGNAATSFVPNPFNIHSVNTATNIVVSSEAQELADMFTISYDKATTSNELLYTATYNGALSDDDFIIMWNEKLNNNAVESYAKEMAIALQSKNPSYIVSLTFKKGTTMLGYVFRYIGHDIASFRPIS